MSNLPTQPRLPKSVPQPVPRPPTTITPATPPTFLRRRSGIWAGGIAVIVIAGTYFGASLKTSAQVEEKNTLKQKAEVDLATQVALLETTRSQLMARKVQLENKIGELRERQQKRAGASKEAESRMETVAERVTR